MNPMLIYMAKAGLCLSVFYTVYYFFLSRDTMYSRNRLFILLSFALAFILPAISIETRQPNDLQFFGRDFTGITITATADSAIPTGSNFTWKYLLLAFYIAGMILAGMKLLIETLSLIRLIVRRQGNENKIISLTNSRTSGFSAFGYIFIDSGLEPDEAEEIINHEQKHLNRFHFLDIITVELLKVIQWFNPFVYLFDSSLRAVHEYQADEECLNSGIPVHSYQGLVMNQVFRARIFNPSNSFSNPTLIKKRMIMMTKKRSKALANFKVFLVLPVLAVLLVIFSTCTEKMTMTDSPTAIVETSPNAPVLQGGEPEPFVVVEEMPMFPGGDSALLAYIATNTKYPEAAKVAGIQGRVIIRFCVTSTGGVDKISVIRGVDAELDKEAVRVVTSLPSFKPGKQGGKDVPVWYMVPITFALAGKNDEMMAPPPPPPPPPTGAGIVEEAPAGSSQEPFTMVEQMPQYPGGDTAMLHYIARNVKYPVDAKEKNISGRVIIRFCVSEKGKVEMTSVYKGIYPSIDAEALRVVNTLADFKPGLQKGKPVPVWYMVPVTFTLK